MINPDAMFAVMFGGTLDGIAAEDRYERLIEMRNHLVTHNVDIVTGEIPDDGMNDHYMTEILKFLSVHFSQIPDEKDTERAAHIIAGLFTNPREIEDLSEGQIAYIEDTAVNVGLMKTLLYSYRIKLSDEFLDSTSWVTWMMRYRRYMVV